jgi:hypothetical protein
MPAKTLIKEQKITDAFLNSAYQRNNNLEAAINEMNRITANDQTIIDFLEAKAKEFAGRDQKNLFNLTQHLKHKRYENLEENIPPNNINHGYIVHVTYEEKISVFGDVHSDYPTLINLLRACKYLDGHNKSLLIFAGDYVNRAKIVDEKGVRWDIEDKSSLKTNFSALILLLILEEYLQGQVLLLRGNHDNGGKFVDDLNISGELKDKLKPALNNLFIHFPNFIFLQDQKNQNLAVCHGFVSLEEGKEKDKNLYVKFGPSVSYVDSLGLTGRIKSFHYLTEHFKAKESFFRGIIKAHNHVIHNGFKAGENVNETEAFELAPHQKAEIQQENEKFYQIFGIHIDNVDQELLEEQNRVLITINSQLNSLNRSTDPKQNRAGFVRIKKDGFEIFAFDQTYYSKHLERFTPFSIFLKKITDFLDKDYEGPFINLMKITASSKNIPMLSCKSVEYIWDFYFYHTLSNTLKIPLIDAKRNTIDNTSITSFNDFFNVYKVSLITSFTEKNRNCCPLANIPAELIPNYSYASIFEERARYIDVFFNQMGNFPKTLGRKFLVDFSKVVREYADKYQVTNPVAKDLGWQILEKLQRSEDRDLLAIKRANNFVDLRNAYELSQLSGLVNHSKIWDNSIFSYVEKMFYPSFRLVRSVRSVRFPWAMM